MNIDYKKVPNIISGKDLDYLKDMFNWNYNLYKMQENALEFVENKEIAKMIKECSNLFYDNMNTVLNILSDGDENE